MQQQITQRQIEIAQASHRSDQIRTADLFKLTKAMPDNADMPDILLELSRVAHDTGIQFQSITPQAATLLSGYQVVPIDLIFQGSYYDLADFVYRLRNLVTVHDGRLAATGRLFSVDSIDFSEGQQKFPQILATLTVDAFVYGSASATGAAGTPAVPAPPARDRNDGHELHRYDLDRHDGDGYDPDADGAGSAGRLGQRGGGDSLMASKRKPATTRAKEKEKRQKIILAVGCVILLGLLAVEGPKTWSMMNAKPPADEAHARPRPGSATTPGAAPVTSAAPAVVQPGTPETPVVVANGIGIAETSGQPAPEDGKLIMFGRFRTKNPFIQQVGATPAPATPTTPAVTPTTPPTAPGGTTTTPSSPPKTPPAPGTTPTGPPAQPPAKPSSATIAVNGVSQSVAVNGTFPTSQPTFKLVSVTKGAAKIGLVGGSYSSGAPTITLKVGKTVTLMNTADGTRYKLHLVSVS